jgi:hypothetical protein
MTQKLFLFDMYMLSFFCSCLFLNDFLTKWNFRKKLTQWTFNYLEYRGLIQEILSWFSRDPIAAYLSLVFIIRKKKYSRFAWKSVNLDFSRKKSLFFRKKTSNSASHTTSLCAISHKIGVTKGQLRDQSIKLDSWRTTCKVSSNSHLF